MNIQIGGMIKKLRLEKNITQERLAEYLNISFQAVSKWENGTTLPDITMLPKLASFFNVTADRLLGIIKDDFAEIKPQIDEQLKKYFSLGEIDKAECYLRELLETYPGNHTLMAGLAYVLSQKRQRTADKDIKIKLSLEVIYLGKLVLEDCYFNEIRFDAIRTMFYEYIELGKSEEASELVKGLSNIDYRDMQFSLLQHNELTKYHQDYILYCLYRFNTQYRCLALKCLYEDKNYQKAIYFLDIILNINQLCFDDKNYCNMHSTMGFLYVEKAMAYSALNEIDKSLSCLDKAIEHKTAYMQLPNNGKYTAASVNLLEYTCSPDNKNNFNAGIKRMLNHEVFDNLRSIEKFKNIDESIHS